jgi:hypothetical protein
LKFYWPGVYKNHGIATWFGVQKRNKGEYSFSDVINLPRGWYSTNSNLLISASVNYSLPLFYPDWNLGKLIYISRVKASLFYDYGWLSGNIITNNIITGTFQKRMISLGMDLTADSNFMRLYAPADIGIRSTWLPGIQKFNLEFLFSIDFTSF